MDIFAKHNLHRQLANAIQDMRTSASRVVDLRAKEYMRLHEGVDYRTAMYAVLDADPELKASYLGRIESDA